jgi:hypothetical protein
VLVGLSPLFHLKPCMSRICGLWAFGVAQALVLVVFIYLCAGEDLPPSFGDADEGWQWEIQTDEGWVSYWDPHV